MLPWERRFALAFVVLMVAVAACTHLLACDDPPIGIMSVDPAKGPVSGTITIDVWLEEEVEFEKVEYFVDGESIGENTGKPYKLEWDTSKVKDGEHTLQAKGTVTDGKVRESKPVVVEVDNS
jgi:hypothetical protein